MSFNRLVSLAAMIVLAFVCVSCVFGYTLVRNRPDRFAPGGVHRVRSTENEVFNGTILWAGPDHVMRLSVARQIGPGQYSHDPDLVLSDDVEKDGSNYLVRMPEGYPPVRVPEFALNRFVVPVYGYTSNGIHTPVEIQIRDVTVGEFTAPACSGRLLLLPPSDFNGYDFKFPRRIGGGKEHFEVPVPNIKHVALNGYNVVREVLIQSYVEEGCRSHRPTWE